MIVLGKNVVVTINDGNGWKLYGCANNCSLSISTSLIETSSIGSGLYATYVPQKHNITGTISGLINLDDPTLLSLYDLRQLQLNMTQIQVKFTRTDAAGNEYTSEIDAYITGSNDTGETNGAASFDIDIQATGAIVESSSSVVKICNQTWMTRNWDGTTFRNGDVIPEVQDGPTWAALTTPAWCYYDNDPANGAIYGKLYNAYAVNDVRGLSPFGWKIPSITDFQDLSTCLGGDSVAGGALKETGIVHWTTPNTGATNSSGFTALPGGTRYVGGNFNDINEQSIFWSTTSAGVGLNNTSIIGYNSALILNTGTTSFIQGCSIRLIKDI